MLELPKSLSRLINELARLPGVGPKTAQRLGFFLLKREQVDLEGFSEAVRQVRQGVTYCSRCHAMAESDPCATCTDPKRDQQLVCVVEEPLDAVALDRAGSFPGVFHVLGGVLNPLEGVRPEHLNIESLLGRIKDQGVREVVLATNPSLEGEATASHIAKLIRERYPEVKATRIARGLPVGGDMEYADEVTLLRALEGRREY